MKHILLTIVSCLLVTVAGAQEFTAFVDLEKRYDVSRLAASDSTAWIVVRFSNVCPEGRLPEEVSLAYRRISCHKAARGEVLTLPEHAIVVIGKQMSDTVDGKSIDFVVADSLRQIVMKVPPGTYELRGGHLRTYRIDVPPFQIQPGDSTVIDMKKTFLELPPCETPRILKSPPDLRADYLSRRQDYLYMRTPRGYVIGQCYRNVHDILYQWPPEYR